MIKTNNPKTLKFLFAEEFCLVKLTKPKVSKYSLFFSDTNSVDIKTVFLFPCFLGHPVALDIFNCFFIYKLVAFLFFSHKVTLIQLLEKS